MKDERERREKPIDWARVHRRMEEAGRALDKTWSGDEAEKRRILRARAEALAKESEATEPGERIEFVRFVLSREKYGIESRYVREVCPLKRFAPVPCAPPFVLGIMNVRGEICSIVDIRKFFDLTEMGLGDLNRVIIISSGETEFGILADSVAGMGTVWTGRISPPPPTFTGLRREYLKGLIADGTAILDGGRILSDERIVVSEFV